MGCVNSETKEEYNLEAQYKQKDGPTMWAADTENDLEKQIFMAANVLRQDPKVFTEFCKRVKDKYKDTLTKETPNFEDLLATLRARE